MHCARGKVRISVGQSQRSIKDVKGLHRVADVHKFGIRNYAKNHAFDGADKMIVQAKIGCKGNNRTLRQVNLDKIGI